VIFFLFGKGQVPCVQMNYRQNVTFVRGAPSRNRVMTLVRNESRAVELKRAASSSKRAACGGSS